MERVVVDSGVVVKWLTPEPLSDDARRVLAGYQAGKLRLTAPDLLNAEVGNVIWKKHRFQRYPGRGRPTATRRIPPPVDRFDAHGRLA